MDIAVVVLATTIVVLAGPAAAQIGPPGDPRPANPSAVRVWTDDTGKQELEAAFVEFMKGKVRLGTANERLKVVPLERLSTANQDFAATQQITPAKPDSSPALGAVLPNGFLLW